MKNLLNSLQVQCQKINLPVKASYVDWNGFEQVTISVLSDKPLYNGKIIVQQQDGKFTVTVGNPELFATDVDFDYVTSNINNFCDILKQHHDNY